MPSLTLAASLLFNNVNFPLIEQKIFLSNTTQVMLKMFIMDNDIWLKKISIINPFCVYMKTNEL